MSHNILTDKVQIRWAHSEVNQKLNEQPEPEGFQWYRIQLVASY